MSTLPEPTSSIRPACPYLGIRSDPAIHFGFPVPDNLCYAEKGVVSIALNHQTDYCLGDFHTECRFYQAAVNRRTPNAAARAEAIERETNRGPRVRSALLFISLGAFGVLTVVLLMLWARDASFLGRLHLVGPAQAIAAGEHTPQSAAAPVSTVTPTPQATATWTASPTPVPTATPTTTPTPTATRRPSKPGISGGTASAGVPITMSMSILCTPAPTPLPTPFLIVAVGALNLRQQTAADATVTQVAYNGDRLAVTGRDTTGRWVLTCCLGGWPGWVMVQHVNLSVPVQSLPVVTDTPPPTPITTSSP